jgi:uncharacterized protein
MSIEKNVQTVKNFLAALVRRDKQGLLALSAENIEWIIPGENWPLAGTHRGHTGLENLLQKANETVETSYPEPPEFIAQGDRVLVVGFATGKIKGTNRTFEDNWVFDIVVRNGKLTNVREYVDTQALARANSLMDNEIEAGGQIVGFASSCGVNPTHPGSMPSLSFTATLKRCLQPM